RRVEVGAHLAVVVDRRGDLPAAGGRLLRVGVGALHQELPPARLDDEDIGDRISGVIGGGAVAPVDGGVVLAQRLGAGGVGEGGQEHQVGGAALDAADVGAGGGDHRHVADGVVRRAGQQRRRFVLEGDCEVEVP